MKKNYVRQEDYDFYSIRLPLKIAFSRQRKKYILRELEKLHPKVTASCFIKSWLRMKKWKLQADVAVMEKSLLAHYKSKFPGSSIYLPEKKKNPFSIKSRKSSVIAGLFLIIAAGFFFGKIVFEILAQNKKIMEKKNALISEKTEIPQKSAAPVLLAPSELIVSVFSSVSKNGGRISSFSWKNGICTFSVIGCSSEDVAQAQYCVVSYKDNKPQFTLSVPVLENEKPKIENHENISQKSVDYRISLGKIRNKLLDFGASIQKEHITEKTAEFEFSISENFLYSALKTCGEESKNIGWKEKSFALTKSGNQNSIKIAFAREYEGKNIDFEFSPIFLVASYVWLFKSEKSVFAPTFDNHGPVAEIENSFQENQIAENRLKIGEIKKNDGFFYIFYRKPNGKIIFEKKLAL